MENLRAFVEDPYSSKAATACHVMILVLILVTCCLVMLHTVPEVQQSFFALEIVITAIFTLELLLRFITVDSVASLFHVFNWLDLWALSCGGYAAPALAASKPLVPLVLRMVWFLRLFRFVELLRLLSPIAVSRQLSAQMLLQIFNSSALAVLAVLSFLIVVSASLLYLVESDRCEERGLPCSGFESIPASFWFSSITLTTVGYGDVYPLTPLGRALAAFLAICAVILLSLSAALLTLNLAETKMTTYDAGDLQEKEMLMEVKKSWDHLAHALAVASAATRHARCDGAAALHALPVRPTLQLLEDKGRSLCFEMQECLTLMLQPS